MAVLVDYAADDVALAGFELRDGVGRVRGEVDQVRGDFVFGGSASDILPAEVLAREGRLVPLEETAGEGGDLEGDLMGGGAVHRVAADDLG